MKHIPIYVQIKIFLTRGQQYIFFLPQTFEWRESIEENKTERAIEKG